MTRFARIVLGVATVWPLVYFVFFIATAFVFVAVQPQLTTPDSGFLAAFKVLIGLHFLTVLWGIGLLVIYIVHLFKTDRVPNDKKALWAVVLFFGNMLAMPVYWYFYIWPDSEDARDSPVAEKT